MAAAIAYMQYQPYEDEAIEYENGLAFRWHGGEYIEIGYLDPTDGEFHASAKSINVWDYALGAPYIERSLHAFQSLCDDYLDDQDD